MQPVSYARPQSVAGAIALGRESHAAFYAGGTTLVDLMKLAVAAPQSVVDINRLPLARVEAAKDVLRLGALARMSDAADNAALRSAAPAVVQALEASASAQLRNMASLGGNLLQRTRCAYFRDVAAPCNKRRPGSGCGAHTGLNDEHAVLGTSADCSAVSASDFAVALTALDARVRLEGPDGARTIALTNFYREPGGTPDIETALEPGELIVAIELPRTPAARNSTYLKVRDRSSYAFALASCAAGVERGADGTIVQARIALGGVGTVPWRAREAEDLLRGRLPGRDVFAAAARSIFAQARPTTQNAYKVELGIRAVVRALETVTA